MNEITIFDIPETEVVINKTQKQLEYEDIKTAELLSINHVDTLYEMDEYYENNKKPKSTIISILLKWILKYCVPIITKEDRYAISVQTEQKTYAFHDNKLIIIPSNVQFKVIGIKIPELFIKFYDKRILSHFDHIDDNQIILSGSYGLVNFQTERYTQQRNIFTHPGTPAIDNIIMFKNDQLAGVVLNNIINFIEYTEDYYNINFPTIKYDINLPKINKTSNKKWHIINGKIVNDTSENVPLLDKKTKENINNTFVPFSNTVLDMLNNAQNSKFGKSFYYDILFMLEKNSLVHAYNIGSNISIDDKGFKSQLESKKQDIVTNLEYNKQVYEGYTKKSDLIKRKTIAYNKYGEYDLTKLDKKQKDTVELEFKKISSRNLQNKELEKLFSKLRKSFLDFESNNLKSLLKEIEEKINKKDLDAMDLLEGGLCPHVYHYGKKMLEHFGKSWLGSTLRDYMIDVYALPEESTGYYCKVCGEKVADVDSTQILKIYGDRSNAPMDDPIQSIIWKEAMYIISSNIRQLTPMPIKPLVNSISLNLRNIIAEEESKLYRSKTTTIDSIKDTVSLYACIYIYASLCAIMLNNPGKLIFAREKPAEYKKSKVKSDLLDNTPKVKSDLFDDNDGENQSENVEPASENVEPASENVEQKIVTAAGENVKTWKHKRIEKNNKAIKYRNKNSASKNYRYIKGGKIVTDIKVAEKFYLTTALKLIIISKETIISRLKNMNIDIIKQIFLSKAYAWASAHAKPIKVDIEKTQEVSQNHLLIDPFYTYVYLTKKILSQKQPKSIEDIKGVLGVDEKDLLDNIKNKDASPYDLVEAPKQISINKDIEGYDEYTYKSFTSVLEYYKNRIYQNAFVPVHVQVKEYLDKWSELYKLEKLVFDEVKKYKIRSNIDIVLNNDIVGKYNNFSSNRIDLSQHFCQNGEQHKNDIYIYSDGKKEIEISKKEINEWLTSNNKEKIEEFKNLQLINERCSKCKNKIRDSTSKNEKSLQQMFKKIDDISAFYQYYETRCPKGNLHDFDNNKCKKCDMITDYVKKNNIEYYDKYTSIFNKIQLEKQRVSINSLLNIQTENNKKYKYEGDDTYVYTLKKTAEWSKLLEVKYNLVANIGLFEGNKYIDIESSKINPSKDKKNLSRYIKLKGYIHDVLRDYNVVLNYEKVADIPLHFKQILQEQKKIELNDIKSNMPTFNFIELDQTYIYALDNENYTNFLQEYLATIIVQLFEINNNYKNMGKSLAAYFTKNILDKEKFLSKPEPILPSVDITTLEEGSEDEAGVSGDDWAGHATAKTESEFEADAVETYENEIDNEGYDVENANDVWENE
jgi:hypothetical protein